jgi:hypothetical protein
MKSLTNTENWYQRIKVIVVTKCASETFGTDLWEEFGKVWRS